jgi:DNA modification methylase
VLQSLDTLGSAKHVLVWVKEQFVFGRSDYHYRHEPIAYGWTKGAAHTWLGSRDQSTIWEVPRDAVKKMMHPTVKPVELFSRAFNNHTVKGDLVVEPFSGSGSQLCAAQQAGRICYAMDNEPKYVAVALERLNQMGLEPKLLE